MTDRELLKQSLDALEYASDQTKPENLHGCDCLLCTTILYLRERLAQPKTPDVTPEVTPYVIDCPRCGHCCPQPNQEPVVAAHEREQVAKWMVERGYATGHGDTIEDLLTEIDWQAAEREREECASVAESYEPTCDTCPSGVANAIRARGEK